MKNYPIQAHATQNASPHDWRLDTLRPLLKKFQQQLVAPKLETTHMNEQNLPSTLEDETGADRQS
jgi:hypothetical protein